MPKLTWSSLTLPPINLWSLPNWKAPSLGKKKMAIIELTEEEKEAFNSIYEEAALYEYLHTVEEGDGVWKVVPDVYSCLFKKLGIDIGEEIDE
jgi:hypothetical protein